MKSLYKLYLFILSGMLLILSGCEEFLKEEPKSIMVPAYFESETGFKSGVTAAYSAMRSLYGTEGFMVTVVAGTDEFTYGQGSLGENTAITQYSPQLNAANTQFLTTWDNCYLAINTINGVIQSAPMVTMDTAVKKRLIGEAKYLRAHCYYLLVLTFGPVSLNTEFTTTPSNEAYRNPTSEIYAQIIQDLLDAYDSVPNIPTEVGRIAKPAVMHMLAKAYIARAYDDPGNATAYYTEAARWATTLIQNQAVYGKSLLPDFASVHQPYNENNNEALYVIQRNNNLAYNEEGGNGMKENRSNFFFVPWYESTRSKGLQTMVRDAANGRPWRRYMPTDYLLENVFADKVNDTRFRKSFQTVWFCNQTTAANRIPGMNVGDTAIWMPGYNMDTTEIKNHNFLIVTPDPTPAHYWKGDTIVYDYVAGYTNRNFYPHMKKYIDPQLTNLYGAGGRRPFLVHRLAETYLLAAEALIHLGSAQDLDSAAVLVNVVRQRAGATLVTSADMDIDFILDEKSRELCGECMRWFDLKVEGKLQERVVAHNPDAAPNFTSPKHLLRPIPLNQINRCTNEYGQNLDY